MTTKVSANIVTMTTIVQGLRLEVRRVEGAIVTPPEGMMADPSPHGRTIDPDVKLNPLWQPERNTTS